MGLKITHEWTCDLCGKGVENFAGSFSEHVQTINGIGQAVLCLRNLPAAWSYVNGKFVCTRHTIVYGVTHHENIILRDGSNAG